MNRSMSLSFLAARGSAASAVAVPGCMDETVATGCVDETAVPGNARAGIEVVAMAMAMASAAGTPWPPDRPRGCSLCMCDGLRTADANPSVGPEAIELQ